MGGDAGDEPEHTYQKENDGDYQRRRPDGGASVGDIAGRRSGYHVLSFPRGAIRMPTDLLDKRRCSPGAGRGCAEVCAIAHTVVVDNVDKPSPGGGSTHRTLDRSTLKLTRGAALVRAAWGGALLLDAAAILNSSGNRPTRSSLIVARVLGGRQVAQGAISAAFPEPAVLAGGVAADALHSATAVGLALVSPRWRSVALTEAVLAATLAGTGCWLAIRGRRRGLAVQRRPG
jgi:hypothetical protein